MFFLFQQYNLDRICEIIFLKEQGRKNVKSNCNFHLHVAMITMYD